MGPYGGYGGYGQPGPYGGYYNQPAYGYGYGGAPHLPAPPRPPSLFGFGGTESGALGGIIQTVGPMIAEALRGKLGGFGFNFGSDMNIAASEFARQFMSQMNSARSQGAAADSGQIQDMVRGFARMIGHREVARLPNGQVLFEPVTESAIKRLSEDIAGDPKTGKMGLLSVFAAMFPDTVDRSMPRGSMAVAAASFVNAGRFVYDPVTGRPVSEDPNYATRILNPILDRELRNTSGLGAGRVAKIFEQLVAHGMIDSGEDLKAMGAVGGAGGVSARDLQAGRIQEKLKEYSAVVASIRDIFAEDGRPDAPMAELIKSLQTLTQGGFGTIDPKQLTRIVRTMHGASQLSGLGLDQLQELSSATGMSLRQYGAHDALAGPIAVRAAAMRAAAISRGFGRPSLEGPTPDQFTGLYADQVAAGVASAEMNLLAAVGLQGQFAAAGTDLARARETLLAGRTTMVTNDGRTIDLKGARVQELEGLFRSSGLDPANLMTQAMVPNQSRAFWAENSAAAQAVNAQTQNAEARNTFHVMNLMRLAGGDHAEMKRITDAVYEASRDGKVRSDADLAKRTAELLGRDSAFAATLSPILTQWGELGRFKSGFAQARATDPQLAEEAARRDREYEERGRLQQQLTWVVRGGWARNITSVLTDAAYGGPMGLIDIAARAAGMARMSTVADATAMKPEGNTFGDAARDAVVAGLASPTGMLAGLAVGEAAKLLQSMVVPPASGGGPRPAASAELDGVFGRAGPGGDRSAKLTASIAKLEISGVGGAIMTILGTLSGGGTATPPTAPEKPWGSLFSK